MKNQHEPIFFTAPCVSPDRLMRLHKGGGDSSPPPDYQKEAEMRRTQQRNAFYSGVGYNDPNQRSARDAQYKKIYDDVFAYHKALLDREQSNASRNQGFNLARAGQTGGSQDVFERGRVGEEYDKGVADISSKAEQAVARARAAYEDAVSRGVALINSGSDAGSQISNTMSMFSSALQDALESAKTGSWNNFFGDVASTAQNTQFNNGALQAARTGAAQEQDGVKPIVGGTSSGGNGRQFI